MAIAVNNMNISTFIKYPGKITQEVLDFLDCKTGYTIINNKLYEYTPENGDDPIRVEKGTYLVAFDDDTTIFPITPQEFIEDYLVIPYEQVMFKVFAKLLYNTKFTSKEEDANIKIIADLIRSHAEEFYDVR